MRSPILKKLFWLNIKQKIEYDWHFTLDTVGSRRNRTTRANGDLYIQRTTTDLGGRSLIKQGSLLWNKLPNSLKTASNVNIFKSHLKKHVLSTSTWNVFHALSFFVIYDGFGW